MHRAREMRKAVVDPQAVVKLWKSRSDVPRGKALVESRTRKPLSQDVGYGSRQRVCVLN